MYAQEQILKRKRTSEHFAKDFKKKAPYEYKKVKKQDDKFMFFNNRDRSPTQKSNFINLSNDEKEPKPYKSNNMFKTSLKPFTRNTDMINDFKMPVELFYKKIFHEEMKEEMITNIKMIASDFNKFHSDRDSVKHMTQRGIESIFGFYQHQYYKRNPKREKHSDEKIQHLITLISELMENPSCIKEYISHNAYKCLTDFLRKRSGKFNLYSSEVSKLIIWFENDKLMYDNVINN